MARSISRPFLIVLGLFATASTLSSCASQSGVLKDYDAGNFQKRDIVLLLSDSMDIIPFTESFESFEKDGIDTNTVRRRVDSAFRFGLGMEYYGAKVRIDSQRVATGPYDSIGFSAGSERVMVAKRWEGLDEKALYLRTSSMIFMDQTVGGKSLLATLYWVIYDPAIKKAVAGGRISAQSSTSIVVAQIITQSDWYASSRRVGVTLAETIGYLR